MKRFRPILLGAVSLALLAGCGTSEQAKQKASIHFRLGSEYLQRGDPTSALREYLEAEKLNPDDATVQFGLGSALNAKGRFQEGLQHLGLWLEDELPEGGTDLIGIEPNDLSEGEGLSRPIRTRLAIISSKVAGVLVKILEEEGW